MVTKWDQSDSLVCVSCFLFYYGSKFLKHIFSLLPHTAHWSLLYSLWSLCLSVSYHTFRVEPAEPLQQLFALRLTTALLTVQTGVPQLLQHLAQLLVHLLAALAALLQLCTQALLPLTVILKGQPETCRNWFYVLIFGIRIRHLPVSELLLAVQPCCRRYAHDVRAGLGVVLQLLCSACQIVQLSLVIPDGNLQQMMFQERCH